MIRVARRSVAVSCVTMCTLLAALPAFADVLGRGTATFDFDTNDPARAITNGVLTFDNATNTVFGTPINLSTAGTVTFSGNLTPATTTTGTFAVHFVGSSCSSCDAACNFCGGSCSLCYNEAGNYVCSAAGCQSGEPASFVANLSNLTGTVVAGLPAGLSYTSDGSSVLISSMGTLGHYTTTPSALNAFQQATTQTGSNQMVSTNTTFFNSKTNMETPVIVDVTYTSVNSPGTTTVTAVSASTIPMPHFSVDVGQCSKTKKLGCQSDADCPSGETCDGYHGFFFDVSTTASVSGPIKICSHYQDAEPRPKGGNGYLDGTGKPGIPETSLRFLHDEGGTLKDVTLSGYPDTLHNVICGQVNSLSVSGVAARTDMTGSGKDNPLTSCWSEWSFCLPGSVGCSVGKVPKKRGKKTAIPPDAMTCRAKGAATCNFCVRVCPNEPDPAVPSCLPPSAGINQFILKTPLPSSQLPQDADNAQAILAALTGLTSPPGIVDLGSVVFTQPVTADACTANMNIKVPVNSNYVVNLHAASSSGVLDKNTLTLTCTP